MKFMLIFDDMFGVECIKYFKSYESSKKYIRENFVQVFRLFENCLVIEEGN